MKYEFGEVTYNPNGTRALVELKQYENGKKQAFLEAEHDPNDLHRVTVQLVVIWVHYPIGQNNGLLQIKREPLLTHRGAMGVNMALKVGRAELERRTK